MDDLFWITTTLIMSPLLSFKGEVYHSEEVQLMLAKEAEEDRKRRDEELAQELADEEMASKEEGKRKKRGIIVAN